jgi:hypothetical protein
MQNKTDLEEAFKSNMESIKRIDDLLDDQLNSLMQNKSYNSITALDFGEIFGKIVVKFQVIHNYV